jgi:hypothetical protein
MTFIWSWLSKYRQMLVDKQWFILFWYPIFRPFTRVLKCKVNNNTCRAGRFGTARRSARRLGSFVTVYSYIFAFKIFIKMCLPFHIYLPLFKFLIGLLYLTIFTFLHCYFIIGWESLSSEQCRKFNN